MCGYCGYIDLRGERKADKEILIRMTDTLRHRGPDGDGYFLEGSVGLGFRRLSIIDLEGGDQPIYNEDNSVVVLCNGEIFNCIELRRLLIQKGHTFRTNSDVEVLVHLYEEYGVDFLNELNGQFSFVIYDRIKRALLLVRDQFGVNPLYYTVESGVLVFASEIKAILEHPLVSREVDLTGLDQVLTLPGLVSPRTMFKRIESLESGHYITVEGGGLKVAEYWDLDYPRDGDLAYDKPEEYYVERVRDLFARSVKYRLQADVPVGFYLSGGLDSSMVAAMIHKLFPLERRHSFSIAFEEREISEAQYQRSVSRSVNSVHHEIVFGWSEISERLPKMIYHCECPVKETYNTCSMALSETAKRAGISVVLSGEGADEFFAGYVGYRFDQYRAGATKAYDLETALEEQLREKVWGDSAFFYETELCAFRAIKQSLYSESVNEMFDDFECLNFALVNKQRLAGRHSIHKRSYIDFKLRLSDHLISDHGDRMALANSVEGRYPFLDVNLIEFSRDIPPNLKLNQFTEKYILKKVAEGLIDHRIVRREKFGFHAPGSPYLLNQNIDWINDLLSHDRIKREGYFNPDAVERLKSMYTQEGFRLNLPFDIDLLAVVLTFGIFRETFKLPALN